MLSQRFRAGLNSAAPPALGFSFAAVFPFCRAYVVAGRHDPQTLSDRYVRETEPAAKEAAEKMPACRSEGRLCAKVSWNVPQTADPSLRRAPAHTAGTAKARGTPLGMTARGFFPAACKAAIIVPHLRRLGSLSNAFPALPRWANCEISTGCPFEQNRRS